MDKIPISGEIISCGYKHTEYCRACRTCGETATIELTSLELVEQLFEQGLKISVVGKVPETCTCEKPIIQCCSDDKGKTYSEWCLNYHKPIKPQECRQCLNPMEKGMHTCDKYKPQEEFENIKELYIMDEREKKAIAINALIRNQRKIINILKTGRKG